MYPLSHVSYHVLCHTLCQTLTCQANIRDHMEGWRLNLGVQGLPAILLLWPLSSYFYNNVVN